MDEAIRLTRASDFVDIEPGNGRGARACATAVVHRVRPWRPMDAELERLSVLMDSYAGGNDDAFESLYALLAPRLYRFCLRLTAKRTDADDCFQETLLKLHRARATYVRGANVLYWSFAIARSIYLSRVRYWRRRPEFTGATEDVATAAALQTRSDSTPESQAMAEEVLEMAAVELDSMSEKNRMAYLLTQEEEVSARDAAAILGTTADAVRQRTHRAHLQLRAAIDNAS
jgi:RNA polymerase sigma-70 factor, ECF subfamily